MLDLMVVLIVLAFVLLGYVRGILLEGLMVCALAIAYVASVRLAPPLAQFIVSLGDVSAGLAHTAGRLAGGMLIYLSLVVSARVADERFGRTERGVLLTWNRNLGMLGGLAFGAALGFCVLCLADALYKANPDSQAWWARAAAQSRLRRLAAPYNPADRWLITDALKFVRAVKEHPEKLDDLKDKEVVQKLLNDPTVQDILRDEDLMDAIHRGDVQRVASDAKVLKLLSDPELRRLVFSEEMRAALKGVVDVPVVEGSPAPAGADAAEDAQGAQPVRAP